jgi:hypothetical protein
MNSEAFRFEWLRHGTGEAPHFPIIPNTLYPRVRGDGRIDPARTHQGLKRWIETFHVTGFPLRLLGDDPAGRDRERNVPICAPCTYLELIGGRGLCIRAG